MLDRRWRVVPGTLACLLMASRVFALGGADFGSEIISARSLGQGGVGVAGVSEDPVSAYTNPAALTAVPGTRLMGELGYVNSRPSYTDNSGNLTGSKATSVLVPGFAASTLFMGGRLAAGVSAVTPYGLENHFGGDSPLRYVTTDSRLRVVVVSPSLAYKVNDQFSVGAGADYANTVEAQIDRKVNVTALNGLLGSGVGGPDANSRLNGNGDGWGYHAGVTYRPNERHSLGLVYHSMIKIGLTGDVELVGLSGASASAGVFGGPNFSVSAAAPLYMPQNVQLGYAFMPTEKWSFEADAAWYDWWQTRQLGIVYSGLTATQANVLAHGNPQQYQPRKTINFGAGANYKWNDSLQARGGYYYQAASQAESNFNPAFMDLPRHALTAGAGYAFNKTVGMDLAYNAVFFHTRHITNGLDAAGVPLDDSFSNFAQIVSLSVTVKLPGFGI